MTREEAVEALTRLEISNFRSGKSYLTEAFVMAINALRTEQNAYKEGYEAGKRIMAREKNFNHYCPKCMGKLEPCVDCISRQAAIEFLKKPFSASFMMEYLENAPSVQKEQKMGRWIEFDDYNTFRCSVCGILWTTIDGTPQDNGMNYCPNCGARMIEPQESEDTE